MYSDKWVQQYSESKKCFKFFFLKLGMWHYFFLPIMFKPYCVSREIQSICFCFFKSLLFCKSYLMSQCFMSLNKTICFPIESYRSLQGINETRTSGILDLTDLYHISRVSLQLVFPFWKEAQLETALQQLY